jgi:nucleoside-diphosphate-sugar epimerase
VYASSSSVYGQAARYPTSEGDVPAPHSPYGVTKLAAEHLCGLYAANWGLSTVSLRYFTVYGPRQRPDMAFARIVEALAGGAPFELYGDGLQSRAFTFVADAVEATVTAIDRGRPGTVYNVGGGSEATMRDAIAILERIAGHRLELVERPRAEGDVPRTAPESTRARRDLGWRPETSLDDGLKAQWHWAVNRVAAR